MSVQFLSPEQARAALDSVLAAGRDGRPITEAGRQLLASHEAMRRLIIAADGELSHVAHRGSFASEGAEISRLIAELRRAAKGWA